MSLLNPSAKSHAASGKSKLMVIAIMFEPVFKKPVNLINSTIGTHPKGRDYI